MSSKYSSLFPGHLNSKDIKHRITVLLRPPHLLSVYFLKNANTSFFSHSHLGLFEVSDLSKVSMKSFLEFQTDYMNWITLSDSFAVPFQTSARSLYGRIFFFISNTITQSGSFIQVFTKLHPAFLNSFCSPLQQKMVFSETS